MAGLNETPRGNRLHIAIFGRRNAGKSSLINALTKQDLAIVSEVPGTTTDPVYKSMEILPIGPVVIIDTAGIDDASELGRLRVNKTLGVLKNADLMLLVLTPEQEVGNYELSLIQQAWDQGMPVVGVLNKLDLQSQVDPAELSASLGIAVVPVSALTGQGIEALKQEIIRSAPKDWMGSSILGDLLDPGDTVVLVVPIDLAAPKGRIILPQVQCLRDILDHGCQALVVTERGLKKALTDLRSKPKLVVTDSQVFLQVDSETPAEIMLTSFSILFARYKGSLESQIAGALAIQKLKPGDRVLVAEACTHHRVADDIGTVKIPRWLNQRVGGELQYDCSTGLELPKQLEQYKLIVHCGACMINRREMLYRLLQAKKAGVPIVNYGVLIAYLHGILNRALSPFPTALQLFENS